MKHRPGFTIIELTIAIAFIGILLIAVTTTAINMGKIYQKGMTMRDVNQVSRDVMDIMRRDIASAQPESLKVFSTPSVGEPKVIRICTGDVSYIANTAYAFENRNNSNLILLGGKAIRLARVSDPSATYCNSSNVNPTVVETGTQEILTSGGDVGSSNIAVYDMDVKPLLSDSRNGQLYRLTMRIGTNEAATVSNGRCVAPHESASNFDYCAVYDFETLIRAGYRSED